MTEIIAPQKWETHQKITVKKKKLAFWHPIVLIF